MNYRFSEAWIYHRADRRRKWTVHWLEHGPAGKQRKVRAFPTKELARQFKAVVDRRLNAPLFPEQDRTWEELIAEFEPNLTAASSAYRYFVYRALGGFKTVCRPAMLSQITPAMIDTYLAELRAGRVPNQKGIEARAAGRELGPAEFRKGTPAAQRQDFVALHAFFETWVRRGYMTRHPMTTIKKPRVQETLTIPPTWEELCQLLRAVVNPAAEIADPQAWHLLILLAAVTGIDRDDLLKISLERVKPPQWEAYRFVIGGPEWQHQAILSGRRKKTGAIRCKLYGLPRVVADRLAVRVASLPAGSHMLFPWKLFQRKQWESIRTVANLPDCTFKSLRSAAGTQAAEREALGAAQQLLGHSSPEITRRHYVQGERLALALASRVAATLPELPPFPAFREPPQT
ncbi:MAG: hypothetical protein E6Q97_02650 [Desulfurellales bacterium]|nr:MAG: hypothetical protein E6Q97_02650 [Desulfurellales bacterium]